MTKGLWIAACAEDEKADSVIAVVGEKIIRHYPRMVGDDLNLVVGRKVINIGRNLR